MKTYIVIYSLTQAENLYTNLFAYLKSSGYWARPFQGVWLVKASLNSQQIRDGIRTRVNPADKILVIAVPDNDWATFAISKEVTDWMKNNLP